MTTLNISQKNVSDGKNTFFKNNKMLIGTEAPTSGTYTRGDVVVNMGSDNDKNNMWICIESGSPGEWILIGGKPMITSKARVVITDPIAEVPMTELGMPVEKDDKLDVYLNSTHLLEGEDYTINSAGTKIRKKSGIWNLTGDPAVFDFVLMKYVDKVDGNNVTINTTNRETKLASIIEKVQVVGTQTEVAIPNMNFNQDSDTLLVFKNGMIMINDIDYQISNGKLVSLTGPWNQSNVDDYEMTFILLKEVLVYEGGAPEENLEDFQEKIDSNLQTNDKTVVGAINELFQSANNGKELIASAIGEPLSSNQTFQAMSNDINSLLSTFKTNMMNSGVVVENEDRFKQLIDKIKGLTESEGNKGIKFANGIEAVSITETNTAVEQSVVVPINLDFVPTYIFVFTDYLKSYKNGECISDVRKVYLSSEDPYPHPTTSLAHIEISDITKDSFTITAHNYNYSGTLSMTGIFTNWYAIGIGEEDNTVFLESLKSILQGEGVSVAEEDDMASLISKIDQEFDKQVVPVGTATASDVLSGKTFINSTGQTLTGSMRSFDSYTYAPDYMDPYVASNGVNMYVGIPTGAYLNTTPASGGAEVQVPLTSVPGLDASNIKKGTSILGVSGTLVAFQTIQYQGVGVYSTIAYNGATYTGSVQYNSSGIYNYPVVAVCTYDMTVTSTYKLTDQVSTITFDATAADNVFQNGGSNGSGSVTTSLDMSIDRSVSGRCSFTLKVGGNGGSIYVKSVSLYMLRP